MAGRVVLEMPLSLLIAPVEAEKQTGVFLLIIYKRGAPHTYTPRSQTVIYVLVIDPLHMTKLFIPHIHMTIIK